MFTKTAQHPVHYVFGCITHAPLVFQAWALEDFNYKMQWLALYVLSLGLLVGYVMGPEAGCFVGSCVLFVTGFMALPSFMASKGDGPFLLRFSGAYANAILAWHGFFVTFYLYMAMFAVVMTVFATPWTKTAATVFFAGISMLYVAFTMQLAAATTRSVKQWAVPLSATLAGLGMYLSMSWGTASF